MCVLTVYVCVCVREKERELTMFVHTVPEVDEHIEQFLLVEQTDQIKFSPETIQSWFLKNHE